MTTCMNRRAFLFAGVAAAPAQADSNFERGFEDQMGRILAYEAVNLGKHILFQGVVAPYQTAHQGYRYDHRYDRGDRYRTPAYYGDHYRKPRYVKRHPGPKHDHWRRYDHDRHYWKKEKRHRRHHRHHRRHHRPHHDDDCDY